MIKEISLENEGIHISEKHVEILHHFIEDRMANAEEQAILLRLFLNEPNTFKMKFDIVTLFDEETKKLSKTKVRRADTYKGKGDRFYSAVNSINRSLKEYVNTEIFYIGSRKSKNKKQSMYGLAIDSEKQMIKEKSFKGQVLPDKPKKPIIDFNLPLEMIEIKFKEFCEQSDVNNHKIIFSNLFTNIAESVDTITDIIMNVDHTEYGEVFGVGKERFLDRNTKITEEIITESDNFKKSLSILSLLSYIALEKNNTVLYDSIYAAFKNIFEHLNIRRHKPYHDVILFTSISLICSYALKLKRISFLERLFEVEVNFQYELPFTRSPFLVSSPFMIRDNLIGLVHFNLIVIVDIQRRLDVPHYGWLYYILDNFIDNKEFLDKYYDPKLDNGKYLKYYDLLVMF